ncbi:hypothetical protein RJT34_12702 [Clitoria ternatea]|uniref:Uncharacterized protein n=1 Tax=Clitoria ternatea TaxID=43366 RepID=A0AAN9JPA1_CLITE
MARTKSAVAFTFKASRKDKRKRPRTSDDQPFGQHFCGKDRAKRFEKIQIWNFIPEHRVKLKKWERDKFIEPQSSSDELVLSTAKIILDGNVDAKEGEAKKAVVTTTKVMVEASPTSTCFEIPDVEKDIIPLSNVLVGTKRKPMAEVSQLASK